MQSYLKPNQCRLLSEPLMLNLAQARRELNAVLVEEMVHALESGQSTRDRALDVATERLLKVLAR